MSATLPAALELRRVLIDGVWHERVRGAPLPARRRAPDADPPAIEKSPEGSIEPGRYHIYVSHACPFAHRTTLGRVLLGLEGVVSLSVLHPHVAGPDGWSFAGAAPDDRFSEVTPDHVNGYRYLYEAYQRSDPRYTGRVTVPVLWDRRRQRIVSNDSGDILRLLSTAFAATAERGAGLYPVDLASDVDETNSWLARRVNGAVYRVGMAADRETLVAERACLFDAFDRLEGRLAQRFLLGDRLTESDVRLFVTLVRLDLAYRDALRCDLRLLSDYPNLTRYRERIRRLPGVDATVKPDHIRRHYFDDDSFVGVRRDGSLEKPRNRECPAP